MTERNQNENNIALAPSNLSLLLVGGAFVCQIVFASIYFSVISNRAGYEPLLYIIGTCVVAALIKFFAYRSDAKFFCVDAKPILFLGIAAISNGLLLLFAEPWLLGASFVSLAIAFGLAVRTSNGQRIYFGPMLPLSALLMPILGLDTTINDWVCKVSARWSDGFMTVGRIQNFDGRIQFGTGDAARSFLVDPSLDPFHGFPFLMAIAIFFIALFDRRWFHSILLIAATLFWAIFANCARIVGVAAAFQHLSIQLGPLHIIAASTLISFLTIAAIASSDQFLAFWLGPVDQDQLDTNSDSVRATGKFWNRYISSKPLETSRRSIRPAGRPLTIFARACCVAAVVFGLIGFARFLMMPPIQEMSISQIDQTALAFDGDWKLNRFEKIERSSTSAVAETQLMWNGYFKGLDCEFSLAQTSGRSANPFNEYLDSKWALNSEADSPSLSSVSSPILFDKNEHEKGQLRVSLLSQGGTTNWLGRFPNWSEDATKSPFLENRIHAKLFVRYFGSINDDVEPELQQKFKELVDTLNRD